MQIQLFVFTSYFFWNMEPYTILIYIVSLCPFSNLSKDDKVALSNAILRFSSFFDTLHAEGAVKILARLFKANNR